MQKFVVPGGAYAFEPNDYAAWGRAATISVSVNLPEEVVYEFTKAIYENIEQQALVYGGIP